jgi:hypothetical protein
MSKTPYELRYELLAMAQNIITENLMNDRIRLENDWNLEREKASIALSQNKDVELPPFPNVPQIDVNSVIELAKILNNFVSNTGENKND